MAGNTLHLLSDPNSMPTTVLIHLMRYLQPADWIHLMWLDKAMKNRITRTPLFKQHKSMTLFSAHSTSEKQYKKFFQQVLDCHELTESQFSMLRELSQYLQDVHHFCYITMTVNARGQTFNYQESSKKKILDNLRQSTDDLEMIRRLLHDNLFGNVNDELQTTLAGVLKTKKPLKLNDVLERRNQFERLHQHISHIPTIRNKMCDANEINIKDQNVAMNEIDHYAQENISTSPYQRTFLKWLYIMGFLMLGFSIYDTFRKLMWIDTLLPLLTITMFSVMAFSIPITFVTVQMFQMVVFPWVVNEENDVAQFNIQEQQDGELAQAMQRISDFQVNYIEPLKKEHEQQEYDDIEGLMNA